MLELVAPDITIPSFSHSGAIPDGISLESVTLPPEQKLVEPPAVTIGLTSVPPLTDTEADIGDAQPLLLT